MGSYGYGFKNGLPLVTGKKARAYPSAFSPAKAKALVGQPISILVIGDSTAYTRWGPYYLWGVWLGGLYNVTVRIHRWAEWGVSGASDGPKDYDAAETVYTGTGAGSFDIWLAALPGSYPMSMFDKVRRPKAFDALARPDLVIWHHGHNIQTFEVNSSPSAIRAGGRGLYFGPMGIISYKWPGVPQAIVNQTPWRDNTGMDKIVSAINDVRAAKPDITVVNSHDPFLPNKADPLFYRVGEPSPGVHPSDADGRNAGAQMQASSLSSVWLQADAGSPFPTSDWVRKVGTNLCPNGDMAWPSGTVPTGWTLSGDATATKNTTDQFPGFAHCVEIRGGAAAIFGRLFSAADMAPLLNKMTSVAVLAKRSAGQTQPYMSYLARSGGATRTINMGGLTANGKDTPLAGEWCWYVASGIMIDDTVPNFVMGVRLYPSFNVAGNGSPLFIQKVVITEGSEPKGSMAA